MNVFDPHILRASDIRGEIGKNLREEEAFLLGRCFGRSLQSSFPSLSSWTVAVGRDGRLSSPSLEDALVRGLLTEGIHVLRLGLCPTPLLYYAVKVKDCHGGVMVTGSHNPPSYNGFKLLLKTGPFFGEAIQNLQTIAASLPSSGSVPTGTSRQEDLREAYVQRLLQRRGQEIPWPSSFSKIKIAWDPGHGAVGSVLPLLLQKIPCSHSVIYGEVDGTFPAHHPDPTVLDNMQDLKALVLSQGCDGGIAFDGDGDRLGVLDGEGEMIWGDQLLALYSQDLLERHPGVTILADVKASQVLFDWVKEHGGHPLMVPTGHSLVKAKMAETGALLAGEMSGHVFFAEDYYGYDDALYAAVQLLRIMAERGESLAQFRRRLPTVFNTPELRFPCDETLKFRVVEEVKNFLKEQGISYQEVDGARVENTMGWWLLRASQTQDVLVARCESSSEEGLAHMKEHLKNVLQQMETRVPGFRAGPCF